MSPPDELRPDRRDRGASAVEWAIFLAIGIVVAVFVGVLIWHEVNH